MRLALVQLLNTNPLFVYRSQFFPWIAARFAAPDGDCRHYVLQAEEWAEGRSGSRFVYRLSQESMDSLGRTLAEFGPTHVLLNERLTDSQFSCLTAAVPAATFRMFEESADKVAATAAWLGLEEEALRPARLVASVQSPDFGAVPLNARACAVRPFLPIHVGSHCCYRRPLVKNPAFEGIDFSHVPAPYRCSFCDSRIASVERFSQPAVSSALAQVEAALLTANRDVHDMTFMVHGTTLLPRLADFVLGLSSMAPVSNLSRRASAGGGEAQMAFWFSSRIDEFLSCRREVERGLAAARGSGIRICIWNMGVENFSHEENQRLNKGLSPTQIQTAAEALRHLEVAFPDEFRFAGFGYILFTPWTRLEDLKVNIQQFRRLNLPAGRHFVNSTLELLEGRPISMLAQRDGLLDPTAPPSPDSGCVTSHRHVSLNWRFKHPAVAWVHAMAQAALKGAVPMDDHLAVACLERLVEQAQAAGGNLDPHTESRRFHDWLGQQIQTASSAPEVRPQEAPEPKVQETWAALALFLRKELPARPLAVPRGRDGGAAARVHFRDVVICQPPARFGIAVTLDIDDVTLDVVLEPWEMGAKSLLGAPPVAIYHRPSPHQLSALDRALLQSLWAKAARWMVDG